MTSPRLDQTPLIVLTLLVLIARAALEADPVAPGE